MINCQNICSHTLSNGRGNDVKEVHLGALFSPIPVHSVTRSPTVFFLLGAQAFTQNLEFVATRQFSPGPRAMCLSSWVASTVGYYNQDQLWIYFLQRTATSHGLLCLLGHCMRHFRFLCPRQKRNSCKRNRRRFSRQDFLEIILPTYSRPQCGQNVSLESYY